MKSVLVTGAATPLGRRLLGQLRNRGGLEHLVGVEAEGARGMKGVETAAFGPDHRELVAFLNGRDIDTVIHCGLAPDRCGACDEPREARVIETMRLGAAVGSPDVAVRVWVVASSSAVYPIGSQAPLLQREDAPVEAGEGTPGASLIEAEEYVRDVAVHAPHLNVSILRLQQVVGRGIRSPIATLLRQPVLPAPIGYDAPLQLLAIDDAAGALAFAAELELAGIYNVASAGMVRFGEAVRTLRRLSLPVLPIGAGPLSGLARRLRLPHIPGGMLGLLRFGHVLDTAKLAAAGFDPEYDQTACLETLRAKP